MVGIYPILRIYVTYIIIQLELGNILKRYETYFIEIVIFMWFSYIFRKYLFLLLCLNSIFPIPFFSESIECKEPIEVVSYKIGVCKVSPKGKDCTTTFQKLGFNGKTSVVLCKPRTGRMHQIRVHLQFLGKCVLVNGNIIIFMHRKLKHFFIIQRKLLWAYVTYNSVRFMKYYLALRTGI